MNDVLAYVSTRGRTETTLPLALFAIINQTKLPDEIIIFDDNEEKVDFRELQIYNQFFHMCNQKGVKWKVLFGESKGQHYNHHAANHLGYKWCWRVDDDCIPSPTVLENLYNHANSKLGVGSVGGSIITPSWNIPAKERSNASGSINELNKLNLQWFKINQPQKVDHLHCSFLYRAGVAEYNLALSQVAHREETLFTYELIKAGYQNWIIPDAESVHLKYDNGGIRPNDDKPYIHDEIIFNTVMTYGKLITLNCGLGDHIVFSSILDEVIEKYGKVTIASCHTDVFEEWKDKVNIISIKQQEETFDCGEEANIYKKLLDYNVNGDVVDLQNAFRRLYL